MLADSSIPSCKHIGKNTINHHSCRWLFQNIYSEKYNLRFKLSWKSHWVGKGGKK